MIRAEPTDEPQSMKHGQATYRWAAALVAMLLGLGGFVPGAHAACMMPAHSAGPAPCHQMDRPCGEVVMVNACATHHASREAVASDRLSTDRTLAAGPLVVQGASYAERPRRFSHLLLVAPSQRTAAARLHAQVNVWRE